MHRAAILLLILFPALGPGARASDFSGSAALEFTRKAVAFGPRPSGSAAIRKLQAYIVAQLKPLGCQIVEDPFTALTPAGPRTMKNLLAKFSGTSGSAVAVTGHYDTKVMPGRVFVGANDGGSSTGALLELARVLAHQPHRDDLYVVFFDGEEAVGEWSAKDSVYGSRHLAEKWAADGTLGRVRALINIDMIGDADLGIVNEGNSSPSLRRLIRSAAADIGYGKYFLDSGSLIEDDHLPFLVRGVNAVDLIDFDYGPGMAYWHTEKDTMDKLNAHSLQVVGDVLVEAINRLEK